MNHIVLNPELAKVLRRLRLGQVIDTLPTRLELAEKEHRPFQETLLMVLSDEVHRRDSTALGRRIDDAGLEVDMVFERWDDSAKVSYDRKLLAELRTLRFLQTHHNVLILGPVGVGKTFVASALGHQACRIGAQVHFERSDSMLLRLRQSRLDNSRERLLLALTTVDLLIIDDFALEAMTRDESRDMYQLIIERHGRFSTIITSNRDTSEWLSVFDDVLLAQSAVDRFKNNAYDIIIEGESYRERLKPSPGAKAEAERETSMTRKPRRRRRTTKI